jgi:glycosyltransferase involved in cell wall biosynthesis
MKEAKIQPLVSIGVPVYNSENCISQALDSIIGQTYENLEVVISDNASTDRTQTICQQYAAKDSRIRYYRNSENIGVTANYRRVLALSSGDYFMWAAADDIKPVAVVENLLKALHKNKAAVLAHGPILLKLKGRNDLVEIRNEMDISGSDAAERIRVFTRGISSQCMLYGLFRKASLSKGIFSSYSYGQEYLLCLQMCLLGCIEYVNTPIVIYSSRSCVPCDNPMYMEIPTTAMNLLTANGMFRWKCWSVLAFGSYYLATRDDVNWRDRARAIGAHVKTFTRVYRGRLGKEIVFQLFAPVSWFAVLMWRLAIRWKMSYSVTRKIKARFRAA